MREYFVWLAKLLTLVVIFVFLIPISIIGMISASQEVLNTEMPKFKKNLVAVITLDGTIEDSKDILEDLYKQSNNDTVEGIVLRIDSPGGAVGPSQEIYNAVLKLKEKKPIVASMGSVAASGGFYSAISASKVLAQPGTMTGSIGVIMQIPNFSKVMGFVGVDVVTVKSGELKDVGNSFRDMTPEEKAFLEKTAHTVHSQFITDIAKARGMTPEKVQEIADGRLLLGEEALSLHLIDGYGDVYDAARMVFTLKGKELPASEKPTLFYTNDKFQELKKIFDTVLSLPKLFSREVSFRYQMIG